MAPAEPFKYLAKIKTNSCTMAGRSKPRDSTTTPVMEAELKLVYSPIKDFDVWLGYDFLDFNNGLVGQTFVGANYTSLESRKDVSFMGPNLGLRWRFF